LLGGHAFSKVLDYQGNRFLERDFTPGFKTRLQYKDLNIAMDAARTYGAPMPAAALVHQLYGAVMARGGADLDHSLLITLMEEMAGQMIVETDA
jgi:2-hydroxy-3-oxopropionate reductase